MKIKPGESKFRGWIQKDTSPSMAGGRGVAGISSQYMLLNMPAGSSEVNAHYPPVSEDEEEDSIITSNHESASKSSASLKEGYSWSLCSSSLDIPHLYPSMPMLVISRHLKCTNNLITY